MNDVLFLWITVHYLTSNSVLKISHRVAHLYVPFVVTSITSRRLKLCLFFPPFSLSLFFLQCSRMSISLHRDPLTNCLNFLEFQICDLIHLSQISWLKTSPACDPPTKNTLRVGYFIVNRKAGRLFLDCSHIKKKNIVALLCLLVKHLNLIEKSKNPQSWEKHIYSSSFCNESPYVLLKVCFQSL